MRPSETTTDYERRPTDGIGFFERYLSVWVALCIVVGIFLGKWLPGLFHGVSQLELAHVNIPVGMLIWVMIIPMLLRIDFASVGKVRSQLKGIAVTLFVNWAIKPFT
ncbi:MAG TPA: arsenical-resistance protein, partial [Xanthobacteraceae bacterium]|nr:arsenical-resistance protein [Xanthobacteraceae bacterium]